MSTKYSNGIKLSNSETAVLIPPQATENMHGGIKAKEKTNELLEVAIDASSGKAYVGTNATVLKSGLMSADDKSKLNEISNKVENNFYTKTEINTKIDDITNDILGIQYDEANETIIFTKTSDDEFDPETGTGSISGIIDIAHGGTGASTAADALTNLGLTASAKELNYTRGVTSNIQTQLDGKVSSSNLKTINNTSLIGTGNISVATTATASTTGNGLMSKEDKVKLNGIAENANNYVHPDNHAATIIVEDSTHRFVTDAQISSWDAKADADSSGNTVDYVHPATHPATMITEDTTHRFVTDTEKSTWNAKASTATATTSANGLMSSADKTKLNGIAENANNYTLPTASKDTLGGVKTTSTVISTTGLTAAPIINGVVYYKEGSGGGTAVLSDYLGTDEEFLSFIQGSSLLDITEEAF